MTVNRNLSYAGCCRMVKAIPKAGTPEEMYRRCGIADEWVKKNDVLTDNEYYNLLLAIYLLTEKAEERIGKKQTE